MKKFFSLMSLCLLLNMTLYAQTVSVWNGSSEIWTQGQGTESSPYLIENAQQLAYIAEMVNGGVTHYDGIYFKLTTDVYIDSITVWQPIGLTNSAGLTNANYFGGHFDGDNHTIILYLNTSTMTYVGIFGYARNGSFANINSAGKITSTKTGAHAGGICGQGDYSSFANCHNTSDITNTSGTGGICGYNNWGSCADCSNSGNISSTVGTAQGIVGNVSILTNCHNTGDIYGRYAYGISVSYGTISNCHNNGTITSYYSYGQAGGICNGGTVSNCYNIGNVTAKKLAGGIVGSSNSSVISHCYNIGEVSSESDIAGGICAKWGKITNCYNTGNVSASTYAGGICGYDSTGTNYTITNCYNVGILL